MPSFAGLESHQPGVDNPEYFQMMPDANIAASSGSNCSSSVGISSTTSESQKTSPNGNIIANCSSSDVRYPSVVSNDFNDNGHISLASCQSNSSATENGEGIPPLPPRSVHSPSSSNFNTFSFGCTSVSSSAMSPRVPPRPSVPSPPSYLGEYIYADPSKVSSSLQRSSSTACNGSTSPSSRVLPSSPTSPNFSTVSSSHQLFANTSSTVVTAVHNALYHALDSTPAPPTLPLKGLTLIPPAVGPKSPHHSPSSPKTQFAQNVMTSTSPPLSPHWDMRARSASATDPPPIPAKPVLNQSLSSPQSTSFHHAGSSINFSQYQSGSSCSVSPTNLNASQPTTSSNTLMSQSFSSDVDGSQSLFEDKYDLSYSESQTLPRSGKLSSQGNGTESHPADSGSSIINGTVGVISSFNMSSSMHESSSPPCDGRRQLGRCSLEDLRSSEIKKQEAMSARLAEEASHEAECQRLEEIVQICAEYQRQYSNSPPPPYEPPQSKSWHPSPSYTRSQASPLMPSPTSTLTQNRIKTNGSLPRDKRSPPHPRLLQQSSDLSWGPTVDVDSDTSFSVDQPPGCSSIACDSPHSPILPRSSSYPPFPPFPDIAFTSISPAPCATDPPRYEDLQASPQSLYENVHKRSGCSDESSISSPHHDSQISVAAPKSPSVNICSLGANSPNSQSENDRCFQKSTVTPIGPKSPYENVLHGALSPATSPFQSPDASLVLSPHTDHSLSPTISALNKQLAELQLNTPHVSSFFSPLVSSHCPSPVYSNFPSLVSSSLPPCTRAQWDERNSSDYVASLPASANTNSKGGRTVNSPDAPPKPPRSPRIERSVLGRRQVPPPPLAASSPVQPESWPKKTPPPVPPNKPSRRDVTSNSSALTSNSAVGCFSPPVTASSTNFSTSSTFASGSHALTNYFSSTSASDLSYSPPSCSSSSFAHSPHCSSSVTTSASSHSYPFVSPCHTQTTSLSDFTVGTTATTNSSSSTATFSSCTSPSPSLTATSSYSGFPSSNLASSSTSFLVTASEVHQAQSSAQRGPQFTSFCPPVATNSVRPFTAPMSGDIESIRTNCDAGMAASKEPSKDNGSFSGHLYMNTKVSEGSQYQNDLADQRKVSEAVALQSKKDIENDEGNESSGKTGRGIFDQVDDDGSVPPSSLVSANTHNACPPPPHSSSGNTFNAPKFSSNTLSPSNQTFASGVVGHASSGAPADGCLTSTSGVTNCDSISECEELLRAERNEALQYTTDLKRSVADLARQEEEAYRELEVERALLEAECGDVEREVERLESVLVQLNECSAVMEDRHSGDREQDRLDLTVFEDMEFSQMEQEAQREAEREDLNRLMCKEKSRLAQQEERLSQLRKQVEALNAAVQRETTKIDAHRSELNARLQTERHRAKTAEQKLLQLRGLASINTNPTSSSALPPADVAPLHHTYANDPFTNVRQLSGSSDSEEEEDHQPSDSGDPNIQGSRLHLLCDAVSAMTLSGTSLAADTSKNKDGGGVETTTCELRERRASYGEDRVPDSRLRREARDEKTRTLDDEAFAVTRKLASSDGYDGNQSTIEDFSGVQQSEQLSDHFRRDREVLDCVENAFVDEEARRAAELEQKKQNLSGKFSLENIIEDSRRRNRANIEAAVGGSLGRSMSPSAAEKERQTSERYACGRAADFRDEGATASYGEEGLDYALRSGSPRVNSDEGDLAVDQRQQALQLSLSDVVLRDHESGAEDLRPLSESSSFCGATGEDTPPSVCYRPRHAGRAKQQRPLTRYLPIKSTEPSNMQFDLRQHIESAGHQIELCTSIMLTPTSCRGYLHKMAGSAKNKTADYSSNITPHQSSKNSGRLFGMKGYNKRWFVFDRSEKALIYYADKAESKAKGFIYFEDIEEVYVDHLNPHTINGAKKSSKNCASVAFCVKARSRTLSLLAPSAAAMRIWVEVIFTGAEGYHTYDEY
ncbi:Pleckstrin domain [Trinorchestia longiramus]|nr:Pleckstrin domain [Trinorchestia longiramus]